MSALAPARLGWCPGALRPMVSGDGLIVRVKPRGGRLSVPQARGIAGVARRCGNGALDLTSRANLQIRGVGDGTLVAAIGALSDIGLVDASPAAEAVRNIVSSPLAGFDPQALLDIRPVVACLEDRLARDDALHRLPPKFSVVVDDGGTLGLTDVPADLRFEAFEHGVEAAFAVRLGGEDKAEGVCAVGEVAEVLAALGQILILARDADPEIRRMHQVVEREGAETILHRAGLTSGPSRPRREPPSFDRFVGAGDALGLDCVGVAAPFGRMDAGQFDILTLAAEDAGGEELRLTPWRAVLMPGLRVAAAHRAAQACAAAGLIVDPGDPRLRVAACPGSPGCHRGTTPILDHAARLARRLGSSFHGAGIALHVSGCGKGCAHAGQAPLTLVAHDGRYGIVVDGTAGEIPIVNGLGFEEAERCLRTSARMEREP